jgi:hypothetical protein
MIDTIRTMTRPLTAVAIGLLCCAAAPSMAQDPTHPEVTAKYSLDFGWYFPERDVDIGAGFQPGRINRPVSFDRELGLGNKDDVFALDFHWRFGEKWSFATQYFETTGRSRNVLDEAVPFNDIVFIADTAVNASTEFQLTRFFLGRSFSTTDRNDFRVGAGIHWLRISAFVEGEALLTDGSIDFRQETVELSAPLPNIGAWYSYAISPRWALRARADWFGASVDEFSGDLTNASLGTTFNFTDRVGAGIAYNFVRINGSIDSPKWRGDVNMKYDGLFAHLSVYW